MKNSKCKTYCKWLGYLYKTDENEYIEGANGYKCEKYKVRLGKTAIKCKECLEEGRYQNGH